MNAIFGDDTIAQNLVAVQRQANQLELPERYELLLQWVLPSATHDTIRMTAQLESTTAASLQSGPPANESRNGQGEALILTGTDLLCPAIDLVDAAAKLGQLQQLRNRVTEVPASSTPSFEVSRAALLLIVDLARKDRAAAQSSAELLATLVRSENGLEEGNQWPILVAVRGGMQTTLGRSVIADLLMETGARQMVADAAQRQTAITEHFVAMNGQLQSMFSDNASETRSPFQPLHNWIRSDIVTARTHSECWPSSSWTQRQQKLRAVASHKQSLLFYRLPLRGNFDFSCELPVRPAGEISLMYGGVYATPQGEPLQNRHGNIRSGQVESFDPPITPPYEWAWCRIRVRGNDCTIFYNGRVLLHRTLEVNHDPWLAIRTTSARQQPIIRDIRIDHTPSVPGKIDLCADQNPGGWWSYYNEAVGANGVWQHTADEAGRGLFAKREPEFREAGKESLLCYYRPLVEGDSLEYDFFYDPGMTEVHPAIDDLAFLFRPGGVTLHPITNAKYERRGIDPIAEFAIVESRRQLAASLLKQRDWNHCRLQLHRRRLDIYLNEQLVYSHQVRTKDWQESCQARFGFFRYAGESEAQVRNVIWRSQQPAESFAETEHQIVNQTSHPLDERFSELTVFEHDFRANGLPTESFELPSGDTVSVNILSNGVKHFQKSEGSWTHSSITPTFDLHGDFDFTASFAELTVSEPEYGGCGVVLRTEAGDVIFLSRRRRKGNLHRVYLTWRVPAGEGEFRFNKDLIISEAPTGRLRISRRDDTYYFQIAENDSPVYRQVVEQRVEGSGQHSVRVELRMVASQSSSTSAIWTNLRMAAEQLERYRFHVSEESISDDQWEALAESGVLKKLILDGTEVTDEDLLRLKANPELRLLYLKDTRITSQGVRNFSHLKQLEHLHLTVTQTDDSAGATLAGFPNLQTLGLSYTRVGDTTVKRLTGLKNLSVLGLARTYVTDASIDSLCRMPALKSVDLRGTQITESGFARLRKALPECKIKN